MGMSGVTYHRAKAVVQAAESDDLSPDQLAVAKAALAEMDATGKITPAFINVAEMVGLKPRNKRASNGVEAYVLLPRSRRC